MAPCAEAGDTSLRRANIYIAVPASRFSSQQAHHLAPLDGRPHRSCATSPASFTSSAEAQKTMERVADPVVSTPIVERKSSNASVSSFSNEKAIDPEAQVAKEIAHDEAELEEAKARQHALYTKLRPYILGGLAAVIIGWWISATIMHATRHRW